MSERLTMSDYKTVHDDGSVTTQRFMIDGEKVRERAWDLYKRLKLYEDACFDDPNEDTSREVISLARLRELADAEKDGRVVILGKAYKEPNGMFTVLYRRHDGVMMGRTDFTAEEAEQNAKAEAARALAEPKGEATT